MDVADRDPAQPDQLRDASRATGGSAQSLHGSLQLSQTANSGFGARQLSGRTADRFTSFLTSFQAVLAQARNSHEQVAEGLRRVAGPIEDEQQARRRRKERREELNDTKAELAEAKQKLTAARSELTQARSELAGRQRAIAMAEAANAQRAAMGGSPVPVDTSGLHEAERQVARAKQEVATAKRLVSRASDRVDAAHDRLARARRRHEDAERARDTAVRAFTMLLQLAGVLPPLLIPPSTSTPADCPTDNGHLNNILRGIEGGTGTANTLMLPPLQGLQNLAGGTAADELAKGLGLCKPPIIDPPKPPEPPDDTGGKSLGDRLWDAAKDAGGFVDDTLDDAHRWVHDGVRELGEAVERNQSPDYPIWPFPFPPRRPIAP